MSACDFYWHEPYYHGEQAVFNPQRGWPEIDKKTRWAIRKLSQAPHRNEIEDLICRYVNALENINLDVSFLQMWSVLEKIANTVGKNYDDTIARTAWIFKDREIAIEMLESLRRRRNQYVHAARSGQQVDQIVYAVKQFVEAHLIRLIRGDFGVSSLLEYANVLNLPHEVCKLKVNRSILTEAIRIRTPPATSAAPLMT